jgi:hypothetical protein
MATYEIKGWRRINRKKYDPFAVVQSVSHGPWHAVLMDGEQPQAWCGSKMTGFNQDSKPTINAEEFERVCKPCWRAIGNNQPKSYRR